MIHVSKSPPITHPRTCIYSLIGIQSRNRWGIVDLNTASLALIDVREGQAPTALAQRRAQPQTHEVTTGHSGIRAVVPVGGAGVQDVGV